jgi:hypothetical protein
MMIVVDGRAKFVVVPRNRREIESLLLARPDPMTRNWSPGETAEQIRDDNAVLGV